MSPSTSTGKSTANWRNWPLPAKLKFLRRLRELNAQRQAAAPSPLLAELRKDPALILSRAGLTPDPWQAELLRAPLLPTLLLSARQTGKTQTVAALALREALLSPPALVLLLSPSERQSGELAARVFALYDALGAARAAAPRKRTELQLHLYNGSRVIALPDNERTVRSYSAARLLVIDEAARVHDDLYRTVRPMLAVSRGALVALSTPFGQRGFFYQEWQEGSGWRRVRVTPDQCPRITPEFLADEEAKLGPRWFRQEYGLSFESSVGSPFDADAVDRALGADVEPLFS